MIMACAICNLVYASQPQQLLNGVQSRNVSISEVYKSLRFSYKEDTFIDIKNAGFNYAV